MRFIAVICGLKSEEAVVNKAVGSEKVRIGISGADAGRAYELARAACRDAAAAVISIGFSGGLDPIGGEGGGIGFAGPLIWHNTPAKTVRFLGRR